MGEMSRHRQSKSEGCRRHDRAGHEKFMPQETASLRNTGRFAQPHPLLLRLMIREVRASVQRAPTSTLQPRGDATVDKCVQHATLPEISYSSPEVLDFLCAYYDRATRNHSA